MISQTSSFDTVYVLGWAGCHEWDITAVYSTREAAQAAIDAMNEYDRDDMFIQEWPVQHALPKS